MINRKLPDLVWGNIVEFAGLSSITTVPLVCKEIKVALDNNNVWKKRSLKHFHPATLRNEIDGEKINWSEKFKILEKKCYLNNRHKKIFRSLKDGVLSEVRDCKPTLDELHIHEQDCNRATPIYWANKLGHQDILDYFYHYARHQLAPSRSDSRNFDYIDYLIICNQAEKFKKLLEVNDSLISERASSLFNLCLNYGSKDILPILIENFPHLPDRFYDAQNTSALQLAALTGIHSMVASLLGAKVDVNKANANGITALHIAVDLGAQGVIELLLENKANPNLASNVGPALLMAAQNGNMSIVKLLLEKNANVNLTHAEGYSALYAACQNGHYEVAELLIDHGANIDQVDNKAGFFPLFKAVVNRHQRVVELLLTRKASVDRETKQGSTSLMFAAQEGSLNIAKLLLMHKANINLAAKKMKLTPVLLAAVNGHYAMVELLFEKRADINCTLDDGSSVLFAAVNKRANDIVKFLLANGADPGIAREDGISSELLAEINQDKDTVLSIRQAISKKTSDLKLSESCNKPVHVLVSVTDNSPLLSDFIASEQAFKLRVVEGEKIFRGQWIGFDSKGKECSSLRSENLAHILIANCKGPELRILLEIDDLRFRIVNDSELVRIKPLFSSQYHELDLVGIIKRKSIVGIRQSTKELARAYKYT